MEAQNRKTNKYNARLIPDMRMSSRNRVTNNPIVIGATGVIPKARVKNIESLGVGIKIGWLQKIVAYETVKMMRAIMY